MIDWEADVPVATWTAIGRVKEVVEESSDEERAPVRGRSPHREEKESDSETEEFDGGNGDDGFIVGFAEDRNKRWRRSMEDAHAVVHAFMGRGTVIIG